MPGLGPARVHMERRLPESLLHAPLMLAPALHQLALDHQPLLRVLRRRPDDQEIHPVAPQRILLIDPPPGIHHPVQECLQDQMRSDLLVAATLDPVIRAPAEEFPEGGVQVVLRPQSGTDNVVIV